MWRTSVNNPQSYTKHQALVWELLHQIKVFMPSTRIGWLAFFFFFVISTPLTYYGHDENSGWIKMTMPVESSHEANPLIGYSLILGHSAFHKENLPFIDQIVLLSGASAPIGFYSTRGLYSFVAVLLTPLFGIINALFLTNYLCWAAAAWISWHFTHHLFKDELASLIAVLFVAAGMGFVVHIGDYSAHLMSYTFYYGGIFLVYRSRVWAEQRPFKLHLILGTYMAIASLQYNSGIFLVAGYLAVSFRHNRWYHLATSALIALTAQYIWLWMLNILNTVVNHQPSWLDFYSLQQSYLDISLSVWWNLFIQQPLLFPQVVLLKMGEFLFFDSPLVILGGLLAFFTISISYSLRWFFIIFFSLPIMGVMVYAQAAGARGYLIYGISLLTYSLLAGLLAKYLRKIGIYRLIFVLIYLTIIGLHFLWSTAHLRGNFAPLKGYFLGLNYSSVLFQNVPQILSLTGHEPTPILFGGRANLAEAGLHKAADTVPVNPSFLYALLARTIYFGYLILLALVATRSMKVKLAISSLLISIMFLSSYLSYITLRERPGVLIIEKFASIPAGVIVSYSIDVSQEFTNILAQEADPVLDNLELFIQIDGNYQAEVLVGEQRLSVVGQRNNWGTTSIWTLSINETLQALRHNNSLIIKITSLDEVVVSGWQENRLLGRVLKVEKVPFPNGSSMLPSLEIRLRQKDRIGTLKLAGF